MRERRVFCPISPQVIPNMNINLSIYTCWIYVECTFHLKETNQTKFSSYSSFIIASKHTFHLFFLFSFLATTKLKLEWRNYFLINQTKRERERERKKNVNFEQEKISSTYVNFDFWASHIVVFLFLIQSLTYFFISHLIFQSNLNNNNNMLLHFNAVFHFYRYQQLVFKLKKEIN